MIRLLSCFAACLLFLPLHAETPSVSTLLSPFVERGELAGAVALVTDAKGTLSVECVGWADVEAKRPMTPDTLFWIASESKPMTAVAVMMLVDEGKIALDDPVEKYLPEFRAQMLVAEKTETQTVLQKPARPITIRDCLSHMSGLPFKSAAEEPVLDGLPLAAAVKTYAMTPLQTEPGTAYQYSNAGINTAARVLEVVAEMPYERFMQERLFDPLGMKDTTFWPDEAQAARLAKSYRPDKDKTKLEPFEITQLRYPLSDRVHRFPMPAGGLFSTAEDTARFARMLLNRGEFEGRRYLSESAVAEISKRQTPDSVSNAYGLGFALGPDWFGHGGAHATNLEIHPGKARAIIWMVQHAGFPGEGKEAQGVFKDHALSGEPLE
ncbi:MAG: beta-lactamase family protein [Verrucomicrobiales bacterium]|nr:beta-lactamase family protein [Verrucomicrobiales bacterium]